MNASFLNTKSGQYIALGGAVIAAAVFVIWYAKKQLKDTADTAAGVVSGNNAITQNQTNAAGEKTTAYEGMGLAGTVGAAFNSASGGTFASIGEKLGGWAYDLLHSDSKPADGVTAP